MTTFVFRLRVFRTLRDRLVEVSSLATYFAGFTGFLCFFRVISRDFVDKVFVLPRNPKEPYLINIIQSCYNLNTQKEFQPHDI